VKGLPLGDRVLQEIDSADASRIPEFEGLSVLDGLNNRQAEDARKFLEAEVEDEALQNLKDLLTRQTLRIIEKLAAPNLERISNPVIKVSEVASEFRSRTDVNETDYRIVVSPSAAISESHYPTLGLFAFLYGQSLKDVSESLVDSHAVFSLEIDELLTTPLSVPPLREELDPDSDQTEASSEEEEGVVWLPLPLEFTLVRASDGAIVDSEVPVEWLPDDYLYLALFWISVCGPDRADLESIPQAPSNLSGEAWITEVVQRQVPFQYEDSGCRSKAYEEVPILARLKEIRHEFRNKSASSGLSVELLNDTFDEWLTVLGDARETFIPSGGAPIGMSEFLSSDCIQGYDGNRVLMLQSHPLKLRWIANYLKKSIDLAVQALEGSLKLNEQHDSFYLEWIEGLSPHQQPAIQSSMSGDLFFADGERGWTETFQPAASSGGAASGNNINSGLVDEVVRQITSYLHAHPYKTDGLKILLVTPSASALAAEVVQGVRKGEFKELSLTVELILPKERWDEAARQFELVDTDNRLSGEGALFPPIQLNLHDFTEVKDNPEETLGNLVCDLSIVPQFLDDNSSIDTRNEDERAVLGRFDPLLDDPTYIASGSGTDSLWVSLRPKTPDVALSHWSTLCVRHERRSPVASDRPEATDFIDIRVNFHNTAKFFNALHQRSHWVITVERHITRDQIERLETRPEVLSIRDGVGPGGLFTLLVSSNAGKQFVVDRLTRKIRKVAEIIGREGPKVETEAQLAASIYSEAREISPRLTLDALGISRVTEEILGLSVARQVAESLVPVSPNDEGFVAWISLDEHPEWFPSKNTMRADMIRLAVNLDESGLSVDLLVVESKLRRQGYDPHGADQVSKTRQMFSSVFRKAGETDSLDGRLWRDTMLSAVDTVSDEAVIIKTISDDEVSSRRSRVSDQIRSLFREGEFASVNVGGLYSICEYSSSRELEASPYDADQLVTVVKTGGNALLGRMLTELPIQIEKVVTDQKDVVENVTEGQEIHEPDDHTSKTVPDNGGGGTPKVGRLGKLELDRRYQVILDTYGQYGIPVARPDLSVDYAIEGPASILFRVKPGKGVDPRKLSEKLDALKLTLELEASQKMRFDIDKGYVTIDVPKLDEDRYFVDADELWKEWESSDSGLSVPIGEDRFGNIVEIDFNSSNSPHLLIAGTTGSGKSEALNTILAGLTKFYGPDEVRLQLIDPKGTELDHLSDSEYVDGEIGWDEEDAINILSRSVEEMQARYVKFKERKVRSLSDYNRVVGDEQKIARWVLVLDEYADLTSEPEAKKTIEASLKRLAQKARAAGIHVIIATQKPDASVISTNLRSNLPAQLALRVKSANESRVIMDDPGAESLAGKGDAFLKESGVLTRVQCAKI
jgi:energy-coupling factor transporter ATP-binding protein EcfA2